MEYTNGHFPLNHVILGGELLYTSGDYIMSLKSPEQVKMVAEAIDAINKPSLKEKYYEINEIDYGFSLTEEDFEYTWDWLEQSKSFWQLAAGQNRYVLFTVDQ